ncbi:chemotaxis protein [Actinacidiphila glaucinigra]|uniref:baeRF3 domain-containing protein n=1 Tax=Actinacidiphila glaucinigra TaxID=235986 RepID=UPI0037216EEC
METDALTVGTLRELRATRPYPAVSLTMPTHRRQPDNAQDAVRLRNLLAEAERRIEHDPEASRRARMAIKTQLKAAAAEVDLRYSLDGLVMYATERDHQIWTLPRAVPERVVLSDSFLTRNLVAAKARARPYWVLTVAADRATLWGGSGQSLHPHDAQGFPLEPDPVQWDPERQEQVGDHPSTFRDEETRRFLRSVDSALAALLATDDRPLYLVGLPDAVALLKEVGTAADAAVAVVHKGGLANGPAPALLQELAPAQAEFAERETERIGRRLVDARSRRIFAAGLDEVWESVCEGRAELVVVEEDFQRAVRLSDGHLTPVDGDAPEAGGFEEGIREDIVDELVETALDKGAEVRFMAPDSLVEHDRIAAVLRY